MFGYLRDVLSVCIRNAHDLECLSDYINVNCANCVSIK